MIKVKLGRFGIESQIYLNGALLKDVVDFRLQWNKAGLTKINLELAPKNLEIEGQAGAIKEDKGESIDGKSQR